VRINGEAVEPMDADIVEVEPGVYSVIGGLASWEVRVAGNEISIGQHRFLFEIDDPRRWRRSSQAGGAHGRISITAAMPGKVVRVLVREGDAVEAGAGVLVVEAMKMQNEIKSPKKGRIQRILVGEGAAVNAGDVLAIVE